MGTRRSARSNEAPTTPTPGSSRRTLSPKTIGALVVGVLALIFVFQNTGSGQVTVYFWNVTAPAWLWLVVLFGAGVIVGSLFPWFRRRRTDS